MQTQPVIRRPRDVTALKTCTRCKCELPLFSFVKNIRAKDGLHYRCRKCSSVEGKERRENFVSNSRGR